MVDKLNNLRKTKAIWREADAVCFDVDSTVVTGEAIDELAEFCGCGEKVADWTRKAMNEGLSFRTALSERLKIIQPTQEQLHTFISRSSLTLTGHVRELITALKEQHTAVYLVSGGFRAIIEPIAEKLNIQKENVFANTILFDEKGMYSGFDMKEPTSESGGKARVIELLKSRHNYQRHVMIGDGSTDMEACPPADAFIGFGGNIVRPRVQENASWFVTDFETLLKELPSTT